MAAEVLGGQEGVPDSTYMDDGLVRTPSAEGDRNHFKPEHTVSGKQQQ